MNSRVTRFSFPSASWSYKTKTVGSLPWSEIGQEAKGSLCSWWEIPGSASSVISLLWLFAGWTDLQCWGHYHCLWVHGWWWILLCKYQAWQGPVVTLEMVGVNGVAGKQKSGNKVFCFWEKKVNPSLLCAGQLVSGAHFSCCKSNITESWNGLGP